MRSLMSKFRFERLLDALSSEAEEDPGKVRIAEAQEAVAVLENLICDALVHHSRAAQSSSGDSTGNPKSNAFDRQVLDLSVDNVSGTVASAAGMGLTGLRASAFLSGDQFFDGYSQIQSIANRHIPMVIHPLFREGFGIGSSHCAYHAAADLGFFQMMPHSLQQLIDFSILARWVSERALVPAMVAIDRHTVGQVNLPPAERIREFLGYPEDEIPSPTPAQLLLFGDRRPLVPRWADLDQPVSISSLQGSNDGASATVGRSAFFWNHVRGLAQEGMTRFEEHFGRSLSFVHTEDLDSANQVIVAQGSALQTARLAARYLRDADKMKVGVLGLTWLRPFPWSEIQAALGRKRSVLVLESADAALARETPLVRELKACLGDGTERSLMAASYGMSGQPLHVGEVIKLVRELTAKSPRSRVWLGISTGSLKGGEFPKREGLVTAIAGDYPDLTQMTVGAESLDAIGPAGKTLQWIGSDVELSVVMSRVAEACKGVERFVSGFGCLPEPGVLSVRVTASSSPIATPEAGAQIDVLLLGRLGLDLIYDPLADLKEAASIVIESDRSAQEIWSLMPEFWRSEIRRSNLRLYKVDGGLEDLLAAGRAVLSGDIDIGFAEIQWRNLDDSREGADEVPELIRRIKQTGSAYDNLPKFWGEVMQPKRGGISDNFPDPLVTVNSVPPFTAALARPRGTALPHIPEFESEKCTGCGECWPICPDSAIGVTVLGLQELLDSASETTGASGKVASAVRRAHKPIAARLAAEIKKSGACSLNLETLSEAFQSTAAKMKIAEDEKAEFEGIFTSTAQAVARLNPAITERFFRMPEVARKGSGKALLLTINPDACQGCQLCITNCPEAALGVGNRAELSASSREVWRIWEQLSDTQGAVIANSIEQGILDPMAASLLSRHCSQVQAVGSFGEPGSGERLAARQIAAVVEAELQKRLVQEADSARELAGTLRDRMQELLAEGLINADAEALHSALESLPRHRINLGELSDRLSNFGKGVSVDPVKILRLAQVAKELEEDVWKLTEGKHGLGRSRFSVVIASNRMARWAGRFPNHPFQAPLIVDVSDDSLQMVLGLARAITQKHLEKARLKRRGKLLESAPSDLPGRLQALEMLGWQDLSPEERASCPPILVFTDETVVANQGLGGLAGLLDSEMPIKLIVLDARNVTETSAEPPLLGLAYQRAFVLSGSIAHRQHLFEGLSRALRFQGPVLVHVHVPIPLEQGYSPAKTVERAKLAVEARVHPLFLFDPSAEGVFGAKVSLEGNPAIESDWANVTPFDWILGEERFRRVLLPLSGEDKQIPAIDYLALKQGDRAGVVPVITDDSTGDSFQVPAALICAAEKRLEIWNVFREISGKKNPFVQSVRDELRMSIEAEQKEVVEEIKRDYESRIADLQHDFNGRMAAALRQRLLSLAGFGSGLSEAGKE